MFRPSCIFNGVPFNKATSGLGIGPFTPGTPFNKTTGGLGIRPFMLGAPFNIATSGLGTRPFLTVLQPEPRWLPETNFGPGVTLPEVATLAQKTAMQGVMPETQQAEAGTSGTSCPTQSLLLSCGDTCLYKST